MEEARYWMWAKSKPEVSPRVLAPSSAMTSYGDSWEEQAFAEDAAGALGGCVWPPRSYSCSFCRRDFRSAQALGGHMNVHRRDRARLKQSPIPAAAEAVNQNHAFDPPYSSQMCSFLFSNPNPEFAADVRGVIRVSSPPPAPAASAKGVNSDEEKVSSTLRFYSPNHVEKRDKENLVSLDHHLHHHLRLPPPPSWSSFLSEKKSAGGNDPSPRAEKEDCVTEDLSMSLNLVAHQRQRDTCSDEEVGSCKRRRIEEKPSIFIPKLSVVERCLPQPEALKGGVGSVSDDLDLELRLGDAPKVK